MRLFYAGGRNDNKSYKYWYIRRKIYFCWLFKISC